MKLTRESEKTKVFSGSVMEGKKIYRSERINNIREMIINNTPTICSDRAVLATEGHQMYISEPPVMRRAKTLQHILSNIKIAVFDGELIVGNVGNLPRSAQIFPEFAVDWIIEELDGNPVRPDERSGDRFLISPEDEKALREIQPFWHGKTHCDRVKAKMPEDAWDAYTGNVISSYWLMIGGEGHLVVNLKRVIREGLISFKKQAQDKLASLDLAEPEDMKQRDFLRSVVICCDAVIGYAHRYSELLKDLAEKEKDEQRKKELLYMSDICAHVPEYPARTMHEALQAAWFINITLQIDNNGHSISLGRLDQTLIDLYRNDIASGEFTDDDVLEMLESFYLKHSQIYKITPWENTKSFQGYPLSMTITIGGQDKNGHDVTNELSYLMLEAQGANCLSAPSIALRYHDRISNRTLAAALDINRMGGGQPAFYSDEVYIPALVNRGIKWEDAVEYSIVGCVESIVEGKQSTRPNGAGFVNLGKILELAMYGGTDIETGKTLCPHKKKLSDCTCYEDVYEAFCEQARYYLRQQVITDNLIDFETEANIGDPYVSLLVEDCIGRGKTIKEGGAVYDYCGPLYVGVANVGNSLAAIKKCVFEDRVITAAQLEHALRTNFEDTTTVPGGPEILAMMKSAPKYGNDDDYVDSIMVEFFRFVCEETAKYKTTRFNRGPIGGMWQPSTSSVSANVSYGFTVGATPDGRCAGEALADTTSPMHGTDVLGPTASLKSVAKLPTVLVSGGQLLNMRVTPSSLENPSSKEKLISMLRSFLGDMKGMHIQFNVVDATTLRAAQEKPDEYKDLMVRVAGYSALFAPLDESLQNDIIARTENEL